MIDTPAIEKLLGELEALHEKATPGPYDARNDMIRALRGDMAVPLVDVLEPYEAKAPTVRDPTGSVLFRANTRGARTSLAFRRQHANSMYLLALLKKAPTLITTIRALMEAVEVKVSDDHLNGWQPIEAAPYETPVEINVGRMAFEAQLMPGASVNEDGEACDQWVAVHEGEHPPCWSGGACWESNEDGCLSLQPTGWRPLLQPPAIRSKGDA